MLLECLMPLMTYASFQRCWSTAVYSSLRMIMRKRRLCQHNQGLAGLTWSEYCDFDGAAAA